MKPEQNKLIEDRAKAYADSMDQYCMGRTEYGLVHEAYVQGGADQSAISYPKEDVDALIEDILSYLSDDPRACQRCEGNGKLWADGQSHYPSYDGPTVNCGACGGSGKIIEDLRDVVSDLINDFTSKHKPDETNTQRG